MNKVMLVGNVLDTKTEYGKNEHKYINFTLESKEQYRDKHGETKSWSTRIRCIYEPPADDITVEAGDYMFCEGKINTRNIETEKGKVWITEVKCSDVKRLGSTEEETPF